MYALDPIDEIQSHILGVITGLMIGYGLNPAHVDARFGYITSLPPGETRTTYQGLDEASEASEGEASEESEVSEILINDLTPIDAGISWGDMENDSDPYDVSSLEVSESENDEEDEGPLYVTTRKQFCSTMQRDIRICPRYSTCENKYCKNFHVKEQYLCPHVTRGSYCDVEGCDLIVIRACRKGKRCNESECSFRHKV